MASLVGSNDLLSSAPRKGDDDVLTKPDASTTSYRLDPSVWQKHALINRGEGRIDFSECTNLTSLDLTGCNLSFIPIRGSNGHGVTQSQRKHHPAKAKHNGNDDVDVVAAAASTRRLEKTSGDLPSVENLSDDDWDHPNEASTFSDEEIRCLTQLNPNFSEEAAMAHFSPDYAFESSSSSSSSDSQFSGSDSDSSSSSSDNDDSSVPVKGNISHVNVPIWPGLQKLRDLTLTSNELSCLPGEFSAASLPSLQYLSLDHNCLKSLEVPGGKFTLPSLRALQVGYNELTALPFSLDFPMLTSLDVSCNNITELPLCVFVNMPRLSSLMASHNDMPSLPDDIEKLSTTLTALDISSNKLQSLPSALANLSKIKRLDLNGNPFSEDKKLCKILKSSSGSGGKALKHVLKYLRSGSARKKKRQSGAKPIAKLDGHVQKIASDASNIRDLEAEGPSFSFLSPHSMETVAIRSRKRPHAAFVILRGIGPFTEANFNTFIKLQTCVHQHKCLGGRRKYASIGTHDLRKIEAPFEVVDVSPNFSFVPLGESQESSCEELVNAFASGTGTTVSHSMRTYARRLLGSDRYAVVRDSVGTVCSLPPLINSERTAVTKSTVDVLVEVTSDLSTESSTSGKKENGRSKESGTDRCHRCLSAYLGALAALKQEQSRSKGLVNGTAELCVQGVSVICETSQKSRGFAANQQSKASIVEWADKVAKNLSSSADGKITARLFDDVVVPKEEKVIKQRKRGKNKN